MTGLKRRWGSISKSLAVLTILSFLVFLSHKYAQRSSLLLSRRETTSEPLKSLVHHHTHVAVGQQNPTIAPAVPILIICLSYTLGQAGIGKLPTQLHAQTQAAEWINRTFPNNASLIDKSSKTRKKRHVDAAGPHGPIQYTENNNKGINEDQKRILEPCFKEVLLRVYVGLAAVLDYTNCHERKLVVPELLQGDKTVYLRDCYVDEEEQ